MGLGFGLGLGLGFGLGGGLEDERAVGDVGDRELVLEGRHLVRARLRA